MIESVFSVLIAWGEVLEQFITWLSCSLEWPYLVVFCLVVFIVAFPILLLLSICLVLYECNKKLK